MFPQLALTLLGHV